MPQSNKGAHVIGLNAKSLFKRKSGFVDLLECQMVVSRLLDRIGVGWFALGRPLELEKRRVAIVRAALVIRAIQMLSVFVG